MSTSDVRQIAANRAKVVEMLERWEPDACPDTCRSGDASEYALLAAMHHLEIQDTPGDDGIFFAQRGAAMAVDYFFGSWREGFEYHGRKIERFDVAMCRQRLEWFDTYRDGIFCGCTAEDQKSLARLWEWADSDLPRDDGTWDFTQAENDFYMLLGLTMRGHKPEEQRRLGSKIRTGRSRRAKFWLDGLEAVGRADVEALMGSLESLLDYHLKREFRADHPFLAIMVEGSILWFLAKEAKLELPALPEPLADRVVTRRSLARKS